MLRGKVDGQMVQLSEGSSVKESPKDKQASAPCVREVSSVKGKGRRGNGSVIWRLKC